MKSTMKLAPIRLPLIIAKAPSLSMTPASKKVREAAAIGDPLMIRYAESQPKPRALAGLLTENRSAHQGSEPPGAVLHQRDGKDEQVQADEEQDDLAQVDMLPPGALLARAARLPRWSAGTPDHRSRRPSSRAARALASGSRDSSTYARLSRARASRDTSPDGDSARFRFARGPLRCCSTRCDQPPRSSTVKG